MVNKFECFYIDDKRTYAGIAILLTLSFRIVFSLLRVIAYKYFIKVDGDKETALYKLKYKFSREKWWKMFLHILLGFSKKEPVPDMWMNTITGTIELTVFPVFMRVEEYAMIGAWIGFKTVAQWDAWKTDRLSFQRYALANMLVVILCWSCLLPHVHTH